jgi:hypothetical protein
MQPFGNLMSEETDRELFRGCSCGAVRKVTQWRTSGRATGAAIPQYSLMAASSCRTVSL